MKSKNAIKKLSILLLCLAGYGQLKAQDSTKVEQPKEVKSLNKLRLSIIGLGYEREQKVGKTTTIYGGAGISGVFFYETTVQIDNNNNFAFDSDAKFKIYPTLNTGVRHYYNFEKRVKKGKRTINNSAGYVGLDIEGILPPKPGISSQLNIMPHWGFQTSLNKKLNFELALGPVVIITETETLLYIGGKLGFNFLL